MTMKVKKANKIIYELCNKYDKELTQTLLITKFGQTSDSSVKPMRLQYLTDVERIEFAEWIIEKGYINFFENLKAKKDLEEQERIAEVNRLAAIARKEQEARDLLDEKKQFFVRLQKEIDDIPEHISTFHTGKIYVIYNHSGSWRDDDYCKSICGTFFFKKKAYQELYDILLPKDGNQKYDSYEVEEENLTDYKEMCEFIENRAEDKIRDIERDSFD